MQRHRSRQNEPTPKGRSSDDRKLIRPLTLSVQLVFVLVAVAAFLPQSRLWGVNHLTFYSVPVRVVALVFLALMFVPGTSRRLYAALLFVSRVIKTGGTNVDVALTVIAVASVVLFWSFRASTNLLGDGQLIAQSFEASWKGHEKVIMRSAKAIVLEERISPGATLVYYGAAKAITGVFERGPVWAIRLFIAWMGAVLVYIILGLARRGPFSPEVRLWLLVLTLFSTTMQLFFGYIENYSPLVFTGVLYLVMGFVVIHGGGRLWMLIVLFLLTFYAHIQAVLLGPSLLYLILWRSLEKRRERVERFAGPALTAITVLGAIAAGFTSIGDYYLPLSGGKWFYGMFSPLHFADVLNEAMLLMPILPLFVVMAWVNRSLARRPFGYRAGTGGEARGWFAMTAEWHFVILILVPCFLYLFLFKPEIGMARDWDLFTMSMLGLVPLALLIINRFFRATKMQLSAASFTVPAIAIYVVLTVAWVGINASPTRSAERFEHILEYDRTHAAYAYETLAIFYHDRGNIAKATELMEIACAGASNPRQLVRLAMYYEKLEGKEKAIELMRRTLADHPKSHRPRFYLITLLEGDGNIDEIAELARVGTILHPEEAIYWFYHGEVAISRGQIEEGLAALQNCLALNPPEKARRRCIEQIQKYSTPQQ
jgi:hypothetical protein